ncbi:maltokinase N-terminal cap-like domain-containing protein [Myceligenerans crystallogenes]|uniref:Maltokinase N-terminal cap domain-containing protein n=1 Tax=Myceligenerans crystallogenes TaxID=316335 RepID=A0ABN2NGY3_9MICO
MAIVHRATLTPTKPELLAAWLGSRPDTGSGETEILGSYRFDDPDGEVGVEAIIARRGDRVLQVPLTYRGAPLDGADDALVGTMEHSALGSRWAYLASADPVAQGCFRRALLGEQQTATFEEYDGDTFVRTRPDTVTLTRETTGTPSDTGTIRLAEDLTGGGLPAGEGIARLIARWDGGTAVVAALV